MRSDDLEGFGPVGTNGSDTIDTVLGRLTSNIYDADCPAMRDHAILRNLIDQQAAALAASEARATAAESQAAELRARCEAAERDAARYRVLRDPPFLAHLPAWIAGPGNMHIDEDWLTHDQADAAVDALLAEPSAQGEQ